jgi:membrane-associated phospholipid phosphatase
MKLPDFPSDKISLYEFTLTLGLLLLAIAQENMFIFIFYLGLMSKQFPSILLKKWIKSPRPVEANNCNLTNTGGPVSHQNGFPSGHTMISTFVFVYSLYSFINIREETGKATWGLLIITGIFFILMPIARVHIKCHTIPQVIGGIFFGTIWTILFILLEKYVFLKWPRYVKDKQRFVQSFIATA